MTINKVCFRKQEFINKPKKCIWSGDEADVSMFLSGDDGHTMCVCLNATRAIGLAQLNVQRLQCIHVNYHSSK